MAKSVSFTVRSAAPQDRPALLRLFSALWPFLTEEEAVREADDFDGRRDPARGTWVAVSSNGELLGFLTWALRSYAEGCKSSPVPFMEGWYVQPSHRKAGAGRALVRRFEEWAGAQGYTEMGSDTDITNSDSVAAHQSLGFSVLKAVIPFRKEL